MSCKPPMLAASLAVAHAGSIAELNLADLPANLDPGSVET
jgi:hypothetical protein